MVKHSAKASLAYRFVTTKTVPLSTYKPFLCPSLILNINTSLPVSNWWSLSRTQSLSDPLSHPYNCFRVLSKDLESLIYLLCSNKSQAVITVFCHSFSDQVYMHFWFDTKGITLELDKFIKRPFHNIMTLKLKVAIKIENGKFQGLVEHLESCSNLLSVFLYCLDVTDMQLLMCNLVSYMTSCKRQV